jgi:hypothetical protein
VEKYRPKLVKDVVGNVEAVSRLQVIAEEGNMPNVILSVGCISKRQHRQQQQPPSMYATPCTHRPLDDAHPVAESSRCSCPRASDLRSTCS